MIKKRYLLLFGIALLFIPRTYLSFIFSKTEIVKSTTSASTIDLEKNKTFIAEHKEYCLKALEYYPELENVHIEFREASIATTMAARPIISSFFNSEYERDYEIIFNNSPDCEVPFSELPEEGKIGILGHELAHILDYEKKSFGQLLVTGIFFINTHSIRSYERSIDKITLERGLGEKLYDAYYYIQEESTASEEYKHFKMFHYLEPKEILAGLKK